MAEHHLTLPLRPGDTTEVVAGDLVHLSGEVVMSIGLPTFKRLHRELHEGIAPPLDLRGAALMHISSSGQRNPDGSYELHYVNSTTTTRFDDLMPDLIRGHELSVVGGKGGLGEESVRAMRETGAIYLSVPGGSATLLSGAVREVVEVHWTEYIWQFQLIKTRFEGLGPLTVGIDAHGTSLYRDLRAEAERRLPTIRDTMTRRRDAPGP
ncbi:fumarate hydratase C-terminal domain-containing protein [Nocardioides hwasunensis]|uniref:Fumarate hydratase C-terminal domain-containing protein n=1 Tax=Nocardioides hwasunensis TaxID=397258 RepID=A0ABR8MHQ4_9ACTN|nr:fumarate hydratase C-terminal domain-containing protein [Nocardioides hwasunensis]